MTEVNVNHPTVVTAIRQVNSENEQLRVRFNASEQTFSVAGQGENEVVSLDVYTATGVKVRSAKAAQVSAKSLPTGVYLVRARQRNGQITSQTIIKK